MPEPEVRDDDVLVQVQAASLNQLDSKIRNGEFKLILPYRLPLILGNDVAGVVTFFRNFGRSFVSPLVGDYMSPALHVPPKRGVLLTRGLTAKIIDSILCHELCRSGPKELLEVSLENEFKVVRALQLLHLPQFPAVFSLETLSPGI
jgi:alcohol dehydrogenase-like protein